MIDLHAHTNKSDGSSSVSEILKQAEKLGAEILAITDHNVVDAYDELKSYEIRSLFSGIIVPGIEITTTLNGETIEIVGLGIDTDIMKQEMADRVLSYDDYKKKEYDVALETYARNGIVINAANVRFNPKKEGCRGALFEEVLRHKENLRKFLSLNSIESLTRFTRNEFYNPNSAFYVDQSRIYPSFECCIEMIHNAGGLAFLPHVFEFSTNITDKLQQIVDEYDIDGIECYYSTFTDAQTEYLLDFCKSNNLYKSGGSDYHGAKRKDIELVTGMGNLAINKDVVSDWINLVNILDSDNVSSIN